MKRKSPSSNSCSSSSSSCCIESSPLIPPEIGPQSKPDSAKPKPKAKRVRAKKNQSENSATSAKSRSSIYRGVTRYHHSHMHTFPPPPPPSSSSTSFLFFPPILSILNPIFPCMHVIIIAISDESIVRLNPMFNFLQIKK